MWDSRGPASAAANLIWRNGIFKGRSVDNDLWGLRSTSFLVWRSQRGCLKSRVGKQMRRRWGSNISFLLLLAQLIHGGVCLGHLLFRRRIRHGWCSCLSREHGLGQPTAQRLLMNGLVVVKFLIGAQICAYVSWMCSWWQETMLGLPVGVVLEIELKVLIVETWICALISAKMFWIESVHLTELDRLRVHRFNEGEAVTNMIVSFADQLSIIVSFRRRSLQPSLFK